MWIITDFFISVIGTKEFKEHIRKRSIQIHLGILSEESIVDRPYKKHNSPTIAGGINISV